jgi:glycosyltransferase involved in cell wall biosynthesis
VPRGRGNALRLVANYLSFVASSSVLGPWMLRGERFDAIFVYGTSPILQAFAGVVLRRIKRAALVTWVQDQWPQSLQVTGFVHNPRLLAAVAAVVRWLYRRSDLLLVQSRAFVEPVRAMAGGTPVEYHPNPADAAAGNAPSGAPALVLGPGFNVVFAGNLGTVQALDTVLDAAERLLHRPDIRIVLVGSGSRSEWLREQIARRGLRNVALPGRFEPSAMPGIFAQASALLLTLARGETLSQTIPSKLQAYLAAGRPVIASVDGEGARVLQEAGAGVACPAEDAGALAAAILALEATPAARRDEMGRDGVRYFAAHFEPNALAQALVGCLRGAAERYRRQAPGGRRLKETSE